MERRISDIKVGKRHRKDLGDIGALAKSINDLGLLHPIVVHPDGRLIAGERRLAAYKQLGRKTIPVTGVDIDELVRGELDENAIRKNFTLSEIDAIRRTMEPIERAAAKGRMSEAGKGAKVSQPSRATDKIGALAGVSGRTIEKIAAVVKAAELEPERFGGLVEDMDRSGRVDLVYKRLKIEQRREQHRAKTSKGQTVADLQALARSGDKFAAIYADPPWPFTTYSEKALGNARDHYDTMSFDAIAAMPIEALAAHDAVLFLWVTWPNHPSTLDIIKAWGFTYTTCAFDWVKQNRSGEGLFTGQGYYTRSNTEPCLLATRGAPRRLHGDVHQVIMTPVREHSRKPDEARQRIERLVPGPYLELFAREQHEGWTTWGNEVGAPTPLQAAE